MKLLPYEEIKKNNTSNIHTIGDSKILLLTNQKGGLWGAADFWECQRSSEKIIICHNVCRRIASMFSLFRKE